MKKGKKWEAIDPGEDDTPSHFNQSNESDNDPMYGAELKELNMDNVDKLLKKETPRSIGLTMSQSQSQTS